MLFQSGKTVRRRCRSCDQYVGYGSAFQRIAVSDCHFGRAGKSGEGNVDLARTRCFVSATWQSWWRPTAHSCQRRRFPLADCRSSRRLVERDPARGRKRLVSGTHPELVILECGGAPPLSKPSLHAVKRKAPERWRTPKAINRVIESRSIWWII